jgi:D-alanyl-lipoteichoic acid acyltransferase DltB (MBOAT superfamily)
LRWVWLLAASVYFYGVAQPIYILQILGATAVAYFFAFQVEQAEDKQTKQRYRAIAIGLLVLNLVAFKYTSFLNETFRSMTGWAGASWPIPHIDILLPIGISFYTFQLISYLADVFRGDKAERHFGVFALYVAFFPKLVAGPIERARNLLPQVHAPKSLNYDDAVAGMQLMTWGGF